MPSAAERKQTIGRGLAYIAKHQLDDGSFESFSSPSAKHFQPQHTYRTTFVPALVLGALAGATIPGAETIRERLASFLAEQASPTGSYNYWAKRTKQRQTLPYPDDLDDTFCALSGLYLHDPAIVSAKTLAAAVRLLLATETTVGGPYRTWLVANTAKPVWRDVDLAVNSNIAYFLSLVSEPLPNLIDYIDQCLVNDELRSPYYPSAYPLIYYISRGYNGRQTTALVKTIRTLLANANTPLQTAICLSALAQLGALKNITKPLASLVRLQQTDGSWPAEAFCIDPAINGQTHYHGSAVLTTALVLEALQRCTQPVRSKLPADKQRIVKQPLADSAAVLALADAQCEALAPELRATTLEALRKLATSSNGPEIINLPHEFNQSLREPVPTTSKSFFTGLSLANLYGWLAYTIYDDFLDGEGQPELLPSANLAMRSSLHCFSQATPLRRSFQALTRQTFDTIDGANAWELTHCRFPVYGREILIDALPDYGDLSPLAERSLGHTLAPLAILIAKGLGSRDLAFRQARQAMHHYLIARQLNDDLHDWQADLQNGQITHVVNRILADLDLAPGPHRLPELLSKAKQQFWHITLKSLGQQTLQHIERSHQALDKSGLYVADNVIERNLKSLETSIAKALTTQRQTVNFLKHYQHKTTSL